MPVGCLGGGSGNGSHGGGGGGGGPRGQQQQPDLEVIVTSSILNSADQFAFMQQTLLMQIFRITTPTTSTVNANGTTNGCSPLSSGSTSSTSTTSAASGSNSSGTTSLTCPTCIAFSDHCCQQENGMILFQEFIEANIHCCVWEQRLSDALASLRYQGYVCPGILVMIANSSHLELMADLWKRQLLTAPRGARISQVGLSTGCVVKPVPLSHSVSLHDVLCLILARLKQRGQVADMNTIIDAVHQDWSSLVNRIKNETPELRDAIHAALGALIKQRKVYYTGNKGYFLVGPSESISNSSSSSGGHHNTSNGCTSMLFGTKFSHLRHSLRDRSSPQPVVVQQQQQQPTEKPNGNCIAGPISTSPSNTNALSPKIIQEPNPNSPNADQHNSSSSSANSSFNLERSQSLRISKKSLRSLSSKGGSLRLSKKEAASALKQVQEEDPASATAASEPTSGAPSTLPTTASPAASAASSSNNNKSFERKNSFLSKLFSSSSSSNSSGSSPSSSNNFKKNSNVHQQNGGGGLVKPKTNNNNAVLATFSAQFPPPEMLLETASSTVASASIMNNQAIYTQLIPASQRRPLPPPAAAKMAEDNNNSPAGPQVPKLNHHQQQHYNHQQQQQQPIYGIYNTYAMIRPPPISNTGNGINQHHHQNNLYSQPPPPLPYRPPPPNPYNNSPLLHHNGRGIPMQADHSPVNFRPSPTHMRLSPSPPTSLTSSINGGHSHQNNNTPPPTYARVSNLKKNHGNSPTRNVRFADEESNQNQAGPNSMTSTTSSTTSSGSSADSQRNGGRAVYDDTLMVIEKSNQELEQKLNHVEKLNPVATTTTASSSSELHQPNNTTTSSSSSTTSISNTSSRPSLVRPNIVTNGLGRNRIVDTIHNNKNSLAQEVIYEVESSSTTSPMTTANLTTLVRSNSHVKLQQQQQQPQDSNTEASSVAPSYPSLNDLTISDIAVTSFKSLTAQKLMAGLSFNSIDTLLEVNAAAEARHKLNESTETVDFGVI